MHVCKPSLVRKHEPNGPIRSSIVELTGGDTIEALAIGEDVFSRSNCVTLATVLSGPLTVVFSTLKSESLWMVESSPSVSDVALTSRFVAVGAGVGEFASPAVELLALLLVVLVGTRVAVVLFFEGEEMLVFDGV